MILGTDGRPISSGKQTRADFWANPYTGYGGTDDNLENTRHYSNYRLGEGELNSIYESGGVWRRSVEAPIKDRLARGVTFLTNDDDSDGKRKENEQAEKDLMTVWNDYIEGNIWGRLHGGGLLYFDYGDDRNIPANFSGQFATAGRTADSINFDLRDEQRGLPKKIWTLDRWQAIPQSYYLPNIHGADHPKLGEVETYALNIHTTGYARLVIAHESRCIKIDGFPLSPKQRAANLMWGLSVFDNVYSVLRMLGISLKSMTDILETWHHKSVGIPNLADKMISNTAEALREMLKRIGIAAKATHNQNVSMHDSEGGLVATTTTATGIHEIVGTLVNFYCGEIGIPYSRLFSSEGGAMAGTAAITDVKNYHESLRYDQKHKDEPHLKRILWMMGYEPESFPFVWPNLQESTRFEEIEERDKQADVDGKYISMGAVLPEEIRVSRFSAPETNLDQTIIDHSLGEMIEKDEKDIEDEAAEKNMPENDEEIKNNRQDMVDVAEETSGVVFYLEDDTAYLYEQETK